MANPAANTATQYSMLRSAERLGNSAISHDSQATPYKANIADTLSVLALIFCYCLALYLYRVPNDRRW